MTIHYIYEPYIGRWVNRTVKGAGIMRARLIKVCDDWLAGKIKTPEVPITYEAQFKETYQAWQANAKPGTG